MPEVVEEDLNIEGSRAFVGLSAESVYLLADLIAEGGVGEGIPRLREEIRKLPSPAARPPGPPDGQKQV
jgi:hypothetical protein